MVEVHPKMKTLGLVYSILFVLVLLYLEIISYVVNSWSWPIVFKPPPPPQQTPTLGTGSKGKAEEGPVRILLVADPQLLGEDNEMPGIGIISRWDSDT